ncbi:hypothetical protein ACFP56_13770 [Paenibacillus septentrionalis]|uniref:Excinuclease n=1 Tax=Paenibacillus septentrionalis TaxID=429342 RepID=A0ABW1V506_9BACL
MNTRYRITRNPAGEQPELQLTLEECKALFEQQPDFVYQEEYKVRNAETVMTIKGDFFMWQVGGAEVPFRYYDGDLYVAVSHEIIYEKMTELAQALEAQFVEG